MPTYRRIVVAGALIFSCYLREGDYSSGILLFVNVEYILVHRN